MRPLDPPPLVIGIAARNEQATIAQTLRSVETAAAELAPVPALVIVALNGCTDGTKDVVEAHVAAHRGSVEYRVIESPPGLVEAQRAIAAAAGGVQYIVFVDADCLLEPRCLAELTRAMAEHPQAQAAWASMVPADLLDGPGRPRGFWPAVYNFADYHPEVIHRGRHLCGRAFAIRSYDVPRASPGGTAPVAPRLAAYLGLERGPVVDDSFLSRALVARFGAGCIHHAREARVYFQPLTRLADFYAAQWRKHVEPRRLDLLFPQYSGLRRRHFGRRVDPAAYARLRPVERLQCRLYVWLYSGLRRLAGWRLSAAVLLVRLGLPLRPAELWPVVSGTKRPFTAAAPAPAPPAG